MIPKTKMELGQRILQDLGSPVIQINIAEEQIDNAIDDAVEYWSHYHHEGQDRSLIRIPITQEILDTNTVPIPESVFAIYNIVDPQSSKSGDAAWMSYEFEMTRDAIYDSMRPSGGGSGGGFSSYVLRKQYLSDIAYLLKKPLPFDFRLHKHELTVFGELSTYYGPGDNIVLDVSGFLWKNSYNVWGDEALRKLATAYAKKYWGQNLSKFTNVSLPSGQTLNGDGILNNALMDIEKQENYILSLAEPLGIIIN